jgi:hypothetical protein
MEPEWSERRGMKCIRVDYRGGSFELVSNAYNTKNAYFNKKPSNISNEEFDCLKQKAKLMMGGHIRSVEE